MSKLAQHHELTGAVIGVCYEVANELGYGFLESVYQHALAIALAQKGHKIAQQVQLKVSFRGKVVGDFYADMIVDDVVIIELKAVSKLLPEHKAQLINYLRASGHDIGLLINYGNPKMECKRCWNPTKLPATSYSTPQRLTS